MLFEKEPFQYGGVRAKERGLNWEGADREGYPTVAAFLDQATAPNPEQRFATVADALTVLNSPPSAEVQPEDAVKPETSGTISPDSDISTNIRPERKERYENEVDWLGSLLQSYPGSRHGNSETRGLDTDFAARTYVETDLEQALYRDILERRISLVVLCGNAGDGKTALLQHLAQRLGLRDHPSATRILETKMDDGLTVRMNLDGSASWKGRSADDLLDKFLAPFQHGRPNKDVIHLLAINDGRLLEWIEGVESHRGNETALTEELYDCLQRQTSPPDSHIRFISLNQRSLVGSPVFDDTSNKTLIETNFLDHLLDSLYGGKEASVIWEPCETCTAQNRCEIRRAARMFGPEGLPGAAKEERRKRARQRLFEMFQAVHLRGETHITIRELRAALVYILFGVHLCRDYHNGSDAPLPYWDRAFSPMAPQRQGDLLRESIRLDPALETHPHIDRHLLRAPSGNSGDGGAPHYPDMTLESARRRAYFEWTEEDVKALTQDPHALGLAQGRHFLLFRDFPSDGDAQSELCRKLCKGISRLESLPPQALDRSDVVPLRITPRTPTETAFWVEKKISAFRLEADLPPEAEGLDQLHRQAFLTYRYRNGREERLRLGAELFYLLLELSEGYQLGDVSTDDTFAHLSIFVQRLVREDDRTVFAWSPMRDDAVFEVSARFIECGDASVRQQMVIRSRKTIDGEQK